MLELRPNCEYCDKNLPPDSLEAYICTYECTFCKNCVALILKNVCPNCGGGFAERPIRPKIGRRDGLSLANQPASKIRVLTKFSDDEIEAFVMSVKDIKPGDR